MLPRTGLILPGYHFWSNDEGGRKGHSARFPHDKRHYANLAFCKRDERGSGENTGASLTTVCVAGAQMPCTFAIKIGAEGETRTRTGVAHYPLKIACLPVPPLRHILWIGGGKTACLCSTHFGPARQVPSPPAQQAPRRHQLGAQPPAVRRHADSSPTRYRFARKNRPGPPRWP
jgi:hypothetical protein